MIFALAPLWLAALEPDQSCYLDYGGDVRLAQVIASRASFTLNREPAKPGAKPYVVRGDTVLANPARGGYAAAAYRDHANGCVPANALRYLPRTVPTLGDWAGKWTRFGSDAHDLPNGGSEEDSASLTLKRHGAGVSVSGDELWSAYTGENSPDAHPFWFEGIIGTPKGAVLDIMPQEECPIRMQRVGPYLVVNDRADGEHPCEGAYLSFTGIYTRDR